MLVEEAPQQLVIQDAAVHEPHVGGKVLANAARQIVEGDDVAAARGTRGSHDTRSDEAGGPGDEHGLGGAHEGDRW